MEDKPETIEVQPQAQAGGHNKWIIVIGVLVLILVAIGAFLYLKTPPSQPDSNKSQVQKPSTQTTNPTDANLESDLNSIDLGNVDSDLGSVDQDLKSL